MRKWITLVMTLLVGAANVSSANATSSQVRLEAGYRHDTTSWKRSIPDPDPVFKEKTDFKDIDIFQLGIYARTSIGCNFYLRGNAYWGWILDGDFEQSAKTYNSDGFNGFGQAFETERSNVIDDKYVYGLNAALGYAFYFCDCTMALAPVIGWGIDEQNFNLDDEGFRFSNYDCFVLPVEGSGCCESKWISKWYGPFVGLDFSYRPCNECWNIYADVEFHWGSFKGKRHVRNGEEFNSDKENFHASDVKAWVLGIGADYELSNCWTVGLNFKYQDFRANHKRRICDSFADNYFDLCNNREKSRFKWRSYAVNVTVGKDF